MAQRHRALGATGVRQGTPARRLMSNMKGSTAQQSVQCDRLLLSLSHRRHCDTDTPV
eukprot:CAMPEP_0206518250 /NCGR_PEP_ID=MMETSP0324_2-20121206/64473_1 /ASSEMBLY_ACC=CAM_ASM_000836 /TAXON_ID=2866 /ORGANISM="Crypthecodinium cohnii, Strain Seligo" /LENGTH=56 /DNA_ID=CAMNT_0054011583 /DNA_START=501 /DNA_END=672 /DNA_ORIENTATION=+